MPNILDDRAAIAQNILTAVASGSSVFGGKEKGPFARAGIRDKIWREKICGLFELVNKPSEYDPKSSVFEEQTKIVMHALQEFLAQPGPPQHIDARRIAVKIGLSHEAVSATVSRSPELLASFQAYREIFTVLRLTWALRYLFEKGEPITPMPLFASLNTTRTTGKYLFNKFKQIVNGIDIS